MGSMTLMECMGSMDSVKFQGFSPAHFLWLICEPSKKNNKSKTHTKRQLFSFLFFVFPPGRHKVPETTAKNAMQLFSKVEEILEAGLRIQESGIIKKLFFISLLLYNSSSFVFISMILQPASLQIICEAAVSHSLVPLNRG